MEDYLIEKYYFLGSTIHMYHSEKTISISVLVLIYQSLICENRSTPNAIYKKEGEIFQNYVMHLFYVSHGYASILIILLCDNFTIYRQWGR